jgi:hypothetical protein
MAREIRAVRITQTGEWWRGSDAERLARGFAELRAGQDCAIVGEADQAAVEGSIPQR